MINAIFCFFILSLLFRRWILPQGFVIWCAVSVIALAQLNQPALWSVFALLLIQEGVVRIQNHFKVSKFLPLIYSAVLIVIHNSFKLNVTGFSYMVLASSLDLWLRVNGTPVAFKWRFFNLASFPKTLVGPIASVKDHAPKAIPLERVAKLAIFGLLKCFILVNLWRNHVPVQAWVNLNTPVDFAWFGIWNYVHLYLEFSGICDFVAACFWLYGFGCPLNFDKPYMALSITDFWKRWHMTLGLWIKNFVFIPFGGSRVKSSARLYANLLLAMFISGAWHGLSYNYLGWGLLQGAFLCAEKALNVEARLARAKPAVKTAAWLVTQIAVTGSWILFFSK